MKLRSLICNDCEEEEIELWLLDYITYSFSLFNVDTWKAEITMNCRSKIVYDCRFVSDNDYGDWRWSRWIQFELVFVIYEKVMKIVKIVV